MNVKTLAVGASCAVLALSVSSAALAQAAKPAARPAAPPAAAAVKQGPALPGVCVLSVDAAIANSSVGKYANTRLQQISQQVSAELGAEQTAIRNDDKALGAQRATLAPGDFDKRAADLQVRVNNLQRKAELRQRELQATQAKVRQRLGQEIEPIARQAYEQKNCSVLLDGAAVIDANPAMDITGAVTTALNAKITQFAFEREHLDQPVATAQTAPAASARK
jgi:outer membrane protein